MSIYTSAIRSDLVNIDSTISDLKKPVESGDASLKTIRLVAGFLLCKVKLSAPQSLAGSLAVNLIINDVLRIRQLVQKKQICEENLTTSQTLASTSLTEMFRGETDLDKENATKLNKLSGRIGGYLINAESKMSKELRLRVMSIASLCLFIGGLAAASQPLMIAGAVSYVVAHFFIHQTTKSNFFDNSAEVANGLHNSITEMNEIIDRFNQVI